MSTFDLPSAPLGAVVRPPQAASETTRVARLLWLRSLFGDAGNSRRLESLVGRMTEFFIPRGKDLYVEGTSSDSIYFIVEGAVEHGHTGYVRFVSGDVLGFVDGMLERPHKYSAHVVEDAVILRLKLDDWLDHLEEHFSEARNMVASTAATNDGYPDEDFGEALGMIEAPQEEIAQPNDGTGELVRRLLAVKNCPLFRRASIQSIAQLVRRGDERILAPGEALPDELAREGLYVLLSGSVRCTIGPEQTPITFESSTIGALLGSASALLQVPPRFEITASEETTILYFDPEDYFDIMEDHFDVTRSAMAYFALRTESRNLRRQDEDQA